MSHPTNLKTAGKNTKRKSRCEHKHFIETLSKESQNANTNRDSGQPFG